MADPALKQMIAKGEFVLAPGIFDMVSARLAEQIGFDAIYVTGYGTVASYLGLPDAGLATYTDMIHQIGRMADLVTVPLIADADTGYGGLLNVQHTVRGYEAAGVTAIQFEDQEFPKKCGHTPGKRVIATQDMVQKIKVAVDSRASEDFLVIARTDSREALGLQEAIDRAAAYGEAGADLLFVEAPQTEDEMKTICAALDKPLVANMADGGKTPIFPADRLAEFGFAMSIWPATAYLSSAMAIRTGFECLKSKGTSQCADVKLYDFPEYCKMIGFEEVWEFEKKYAL
ncbi:MAG: isocitrate lyase/PEP mutase family protein [Alphaproteobacteria bacterium]|nr:isocitrate lyase/PEP mutase family protein [Alphaproteobacteria bacterium]